MAPIITVVWALTYSSHLFGNRGRTIRLQQIAKQAPKKRKVAGSRERSTEVPGVIFTPTCWTSGPNHSCPVKQTGTGKACGWNIPPFGSPQLSQETAVLYPMEQPGLAQMDYENVGTIKTDSFSSPVPSKPLQRRESGPFSFDSLEGLHPNLLKKSCCLSLPLTQLWQLYSMRAFNPLFYFLTQTSALHSTQGKTATWESDTMHDKVKLIKKITKKICWAVNWYKLY